MKYLYVLFALMLVFGSMGAMAAPADEPHAKSSVRVRRASCNLRNCEQTCKRLGYTGGACINNGTKCDCDRIEDQPETDSSYQKQSQNPIHSEETKIRIVQADNDGGLRIFCEYCNSWVCDEMCTILGFDGGACNDNWTECKCYTFHTESTSTTQSAVRLRRHAGTEAGTPASDTTTELGDQ
ncbi:hypothetical protein EVAR_27266_1 [Eumeta japonica]|uniref:Uncharacterized protein n=1 Tax=Eumeta variegata TaxID=151549 RepID=A0A4C1W1D9_EUMVA|nr:hypothetical protein EVAR_27266_1 [Eumeta japonica]